MARPLRIEYSNAVYHVMNHGLNRRPIFLTEVDYRNFLSVLQQSWERWDIEIYAYCLMNNHYHLCFMTPEAKLSRVMRHINGIYTQRFNRTHGRDGPLFRGRYKALLIEADEYLAQVVRYIHLNPVKANMVKEPQKYRWNSHQDYLYSRKRPPWLKTQRVGAWFGRPRNFHTYVMEGNDKALESWYTTKRMPLILGTEYFIEEVRQRAGVLSREHVRKESKYIRPSLEKVLTAVVKTYGISVSEVLASRRGESHEARKVALWLVREVCDYPHEEIAKRFGLGSGKTVGWACREVRQLLQESGRLRSRVRKMKQLLET